MYDAKRLIGRLYGDPQLQKDLPHFPFKVVQVDGKPQIVLHRGKTELRMPPEEVRDHMHTLFTGHGTSHRLICETGYQVHERRRVPPNNFAFVYVCFQN